MLCDQVKTIAEQMDAAFLGIGYDPKSSLEQVPIMPKNRWVLNGCRDVMQLKSVFVRHLSFQIQTDAELHADER